MNKDLYITYLYNFIKDNKTTEKSYFYYENNVMNNSEISNDVTHFIFEFNYNSNYISCFIIQYQ